MKRPWVHMSSPSYFIFYFVFWLRPVACGILVLRLKVEPRPLAVKAWSPKYWTAGEFLQYTFFGGMKAICFQVEKVRYIVFGDANSQMLHAVE